MFGTEQRTTSLAQSSYPARMPAFGVILPFAAALIAGTGGSFSPYNIPIIETFTLRPLFTVRAHASKPVSEPGLTTSQLVSHVQASFGLNFSQTAKIFGVTRQAIYDWMRGSRPREEAAAKLWSLYELGKTAPKSLTIPRSSSLSRPVMDGKSLLEILIMNGPVAEALSLLESMPEVTSTRVGVRRLRHSGHRFTVDEIIRTTV